MDMYLHFEESSANIFFMRENIFFTFTTCHSQAAISVANNNVYKGWKRHIHIKHESMRTSIVNGDILLELMRLERNLDDPFIKELSRKLVSKFSIRIGLKYV